MDKGDLLQMISDEKIRNEQHKTNYQLLKTDYERLKNDNIKLQNELKVCKDTNADSVDLNKKNNIRLQKEVSDLKAELTFQKSQELELREKFKTDIKRELESFYKEKFGKLESEADKYREDFNKLRYDYTYLKSEYEHLQHESSRIVEEKKLQYETEINHLQKELEMLINKKSADFSLESQQVQKLRRENTQLNLKLKSFAAELEGLRSQDIQAKMKDDEISRVMKKQISDYVEAIKALEIDKNSLLSIKDGLKDELSNCRENLASLSSELTSANQKVETLKNGTEELKHELKLQKADFVVEMAKLKTDYERELNHASHTIEEHNLEIVLLKDRCDKQNALILDKEKQIEVMKKSKEDYEYSKITELEIAKSNVELERDSFKRVINEMESKYASEKYVTSDKIASFQSEIRQLKTELDSLRDIEENFRRLSVKLEFEIEGNVDKQRKLELLLIERKRQSEVEIGLLDQKSKLESALEKIELELNKTKKKLEDLGTEHSNEVKMLQSRLLMCEEEFKKQLKNIKLENIDQSSKIDEELSHLKNKKKQYVHLIKKLRSKMQVQQTTIENLESKLKVLSKCVPAEEHEIIKKKLRSLEKKVNEYKQIAFGSTNANFSSIDKTLYQMNEQENDDLNYLKIKLENLEKEQQVRLLELQNLNKVSDS